MFSFSRFHRLSSEADLAGLEDVVVAWEAQVSIDLLVISLTVYKSWRNSRVEGRGPLRTGSPLMYVVYRDCQLLHSFRDVSVLY